MSMKTPETLTAQQRAESLLASSRKGHPVSNKDKAKEAARASLLKTSRNATADLNPLAEVDGSVSRLSIYDIEPYHLNPRTRPNPHYAQIKDSIRANGITNMITVTRAPGADKYTPYGGGNTRLRIARELYEEEGDQRFGQLTVTVKEWTGESAVISAHLSENENRGDISFWEKAQGVQSFCHELESEDGHEGATSKLTAGEINKELKGRGLNFGVKMIQNFLFAIEHLAPIGPWLTAFELNATIRPAVGSYLDVAARLDVIEAVRKALHGILKMHGDDLEAAERANEELDAEDRKPVALDIDSLMIDLQSAAAHALNVPAEKLALMCQALAQNPRLGEKDLLNIQATESMVARREEKKPASATQKPLNLMGAMPTPAATRTAAGTGAAAAAPAPEPDCDVAEATQQDSEHEHLQRALTNLNQLVPLADFFCAMPELPMGYMVDFPQSFDRAGETVFDSTVTQLREMVWVMLAMESGQFHDGCARAIVQSNDQLAFSKAYTAGPEAMKSACAALGFTYGSGVLCITSYEYQSLTWHPQLAVIVNDLLAALRNTRIQNIPPDFAYAALFSG